MYHPGIDAHLINGTGTVQLMSNFLDAIASGARSAACQLLGVPQYLDDMIQRVGFPVYNNPLVGIPNFWRNALCDTDAPPPTAPPFTGGQCPGVLYRVDTLNRFRVNSTNQEAQTTDRYFNVPGPVRQEVRTVNQARVLFVIGGDGSERGGIGINPSTNTILFQGITSIFRQDGQPDNCGNPDPVYPPLAPPDVTIPRNVTYNNSSNVEVTIPVIFVFARATIDATANISIPFTANINGTVNVTGNLNLDGTVNINIGSAGNPPAPKDPRKGDCDDIALPDGEVPEDPTDSDQPPEPDRENEEVIIGVLVTVTDLANERATLIVQTDNPDIYAPSLGFVQFLCRIGEGSAAWTSDQPVKNRRNLIPCPWSLGAIAVRGTPQPGVEWTLTPITGYAGQPVEYVTA